MCVCLENTFFQYFIWPSHRHTQNSNNQRSVVCRYFPTTNVMCIMEVCMSYWKQQCKKSENVLCTGIPHLVFLIGSKKTGH